MNKWVFRTVAVLLTVTLALTGCSQPKSQPDTAGFTCRATVQYREMDVEGTLTCTEDGKMTLDFTLPKSLQGITLGWDGNEMTMGLGGMDMTLPADSVPQSALIRCLLQVLTASHPAGNETDEGYVISGEVEGVAYALVCDPSTGLPLSLSVPGQELEAVFTDMQKLKT